MARSSWKLIYDCFNLLKNKTDKEPSLLDNKRRFWILPQHLGNKFDLPKSFKTTKSIEITELMIGMKIGQLITTKKKVRHRIRKKKKKK